LSNVGVRGVVLRLAGFEFLFADPWLDGGAVVVIASEV